MEEQVRSFLKERFGDTVTEDNFRGQQFFHIAPASLVPVCEALQGDPGLDIKYLADITVVDWLDHPEEQKGRFEVVYNLLSLTRRHRIFITVRVNGDSPIVASLCDLWPSADWLEREAFDLFGIEFEGHPDLRKILTPEELDGHPLRKDFPLMYEQPQFSWNKNDPPEVIG